MTGLVQFLYNTLEESTRGDSLPRGGNMAIKGYVIRKTLDLLFFSLSFFFFFKKTKPNKNPKAKPF